MKKVERNGSTTPSNVRARACGKKRKGSARSGLEVNWIEDKGNKEAGETKKRRVKEIETPGVIVVVVIVDVVHVPSHGQRASKNIARRKDTK